MHPQDISKVSCCNRTPDSSSSTSCQQSYCAVQHGCTVEGLPLTALAVPVAALLSLALLYRFIYLRRTRYHIGSEQLISRHGVLSRKTDYMEQYRIVDFVEHQSLMQQLCGLKTVRIFSMDRNTPRLDLVGIRHNFDVVTLIRERVEYNKRKKGIYEITNH